MSTEHTEYVWCSHISELSRYKMVYTFRGLKLKRRNLINIKYPAKNVKHIDKHETDFQTSRVAMYHMC